MAISLVAILLSGIMAACGGGGSNSISASASWQNPNLPGGTIQGGGVTNPGGILLATPTPVQVEANQSTIAVDIQVPAAVSPINVTAVALTAPNTGSTYLQSTGVGASQGKQYWLWLAGTGITPSLTLSISGPGDIAVSGPAMGMQGATGAIYPITVSASAEPDARTIILKDASGNVTTLAGGLEVCSASAPTC
ncbi:MAG: hypothetical protein ABSD88_01420 [Candidatus Korobacteraceae bacterium]